jgi:MFS family permease
MSEHQIDDVHARRLFIGSCFALIATSVAFATVGAVMLALKREFVLSNEQVGWIGGAALWGFAVSQLIFSPLCDTLGMRFLLRLAFVGHLIGAIVMIASTGFWMLFTGALVIALANGLVEAACNPLVATLYPEDKTVKLNQFHVWFPGGIVLGGVAAYLMDLAGIGQWQMKLALIFIPTLIYGYLMLREEFPATEGVQAGVSMSQMFKAALATPLMLLMLFCMAITASTELGPNRWVPAVLESGGIPGILVLVWISGLMAVLRYKAGAIVHRLSPTGLLLASAIVSAIGLYWLSYAESTAIAFLSATVFAVGICYFWPTMLGFVSERVPRSGALGLGLMGAMGMAVVGLITSPWMGSVADRLAHETLPVNETTAFFQEVGATYPELASAATDGMRGDIERANAAVQSVLSALDAEGRLPEIATANALRAVIDSESAILTTGDEAAAALPGQAAAILGPADNYGGRLSFRYIVPFTCLLTVIFGLLYLNDRRKGGYEVKSIHA